PGRRRRRVTCPARLRGGASRAEVRLAARRLRSIGGARGLRRGGPGAEEQGSGAAAAAAAETGPRIEQASAALAPGRRAGQRGPGPPAAARGASYTPGTPYKVSCSPTSGAVPPYSSSPNPYQTAVYPVRSAYPQQSPYAQQGTYYTQPLYAAPPHVIHHTTVVQPNGMPATVYPAPIPPPRGNGVTMGMVAGTTMAMSAGTLLTAHSPTPVAPHPVTVPTYRAPGTPTYSYVPPQW
uniref:Family with sequence similarity 168 member B n=1 Tax=Equus asinus TaxID=9793 RepID=A0A9L0K530_EQUAS